MMTTLREAVSQKPNWAEPIEKPGLDLLEKEEIKVKRPSMWNIVFYNDDYTPMDFVEFVLKKVFHIYPCPVETGSLNVLYSALALR